MIRIYTFVFNYILPVFIIKMLQNIFIYQPRKRTLNIKHGKYSLFTGVFFELRTKCNGTCEFCAASIQNDPREDTLMPFESYTNVIDQLSNIGYTDPVMFHINNEPFLIYELPVFIEYARKQLTDSWLVIYTNGKAMTYQKAYDAIKAGINEIHINDYDGEFKKRRPELYSCIREEILPVFYKPENIYIGDGHQNLDASKDFMLNMHDRSTCEIKTTRAGTAPNKKNLSKKPKGFCEYPFTQLNITTDGSVSMCCADMFFNEKMGNINENTIIEIWNSDKFNRIRYDLLKGNRKNMSTCAKCDYYGLPWETLRTRMARFIYHFTQ